MNNNTLAIRLFTGLTAISTAAVAGAQSESVLEEITVTARKRSESFQEVPVAINVFTADDVESAGIDTPHDFIALTPNVNIVQTQNAGNAFIVVRGVSQARNSEPSVAVLLDGVPMANPAQFNQELFDIQQIEVLKGPQGALYGRNAIGGAITITTKEPGQEFEGQVKVSAEEEGYKVQGTVSGPVGTANTLFYRGAISYKDVDGYIDNPYLGEPADPYQDTSARLKFLWLPNENFAADLRFYQSTLETQGFWFNIVSDVNDTSLPVRVNNAGINERDLFNTSLKLEWDTASGGSLTAITSYDTLEEITTGDSFDFLPITESFNWTTLSVDILGGNPGDIPDWNQSQYFDIESISQEVRFTSPGDQPVRWIVGAYAIATDRFVSTGNMVDTGNGVFPVYQNPRGNFPFDFATDPINPQATFLADSQDNFAWAVFGDIAVDINARTEASFSLRYDKDKRENTTETPNAFFQGELVGASFTGEVREETFDAWQPKFTLRYSPRDNISFYGALSRGFRSGGFNQAGVESAGVLGVKDVFEEEVADTVEFGYKGQFRDNRLKLAFNLYKTWSEGPYYFVFLADSSTQNLGNLDEVEYWGGEFELDALVTDHLSLNLGIGYTDSEITADAEIPSAQGNQAPLVSEYTFNLGLDYRRPLDFADGLDSFIRADYQIIGDTWWDPQNSTVRDPVNLLDLRLGIDAVDNWSLALWSKNLTDEEYNTEFSPGGFVFKALPRRWGVDFIKRF